MLHRRTKRIEFLDDVRFYKTIIVEITLDRYKEWELTIKDFGLKTNNNKRLLAEKELKNQLRQMHRDYLDDKLEPSLKLIYAEYVKPFYGRSQTNQIENIKRMREEHNRQKQEDKDDKRE